MKSVSLVTLFMKRGRRALIYIRLAPAGIVALLGLALSTEAARAQYIGQFLPAYVPGLDESRGLTVLQRPRSEYDSQGVRVGSFLLHGGNSENFGFNDNVLASRSNGQSSSYIETAPSANASADWSRGRLGLSASLDRTDYLSASQESFTNWNFAAGGGVTILRDSLNVAYSHIHANEFASEAGAQTFTRPLGFDVDVVRSDYTFDLGRLKITPNIDIERYDYGNTLIGSQTANESVFDRYLFAGGVTTRFEFSAQRAVVLVLQGAHSTFFHQTAGSPTQDSSSFLVLPGIDYQATGPWRYRLLLGFEVRHFRSAIFPTETAPVIEGNVIFTPTELTTITGTLRREIEDPQASDTSGYTQTTASLQVDHELRRNILLGANASYQSVDYFQNLGSTRAISLNASATWLLNPHLSASASVQFTRQDVDQGHPTGVGSLALSPFTQNVALIGLRWQL